MSETTQKPAALSAAGLAYLGDAVWEMYIRRRLVLSGISRPSEASLRYVTAEAQSDAVERLLPHLTEEEADAYRRGRNSGHGNVPKHAAVAQYRRATGLEALFGFLDLSGRTARIEELISLAFPEL